MKVFLALFKWAKDSPLKKNCASTRGESLSDKKEFQTDKRHSLPRVGHETGIRMGLNETKTN